MIIDTTEATFWVCVYVMGYLISFVPLSKFLFTLGKDSGQTVDENRKAAIGGAFILALMWPVCMFFYALYLVGTICGGFLGLISSPLGRGWLK